MKPITKQLIRGVIIVLFLGLVWFGISFYIFQQKEKEIKNYEDQIDQFVPITEEKTGQTEYILKELIDRKKIARDRSREQDIKAIVMAQFLHHAETGAFLTSATWPSQIGSYTTKTLIGSWDENYVWVDNTKDDQKFCVYAILEKGGWYAASHQGSFECIDTVPTLNDCCF